MKCLYIESGDDIFSTDTEYPIVISLVPRFFGVSASGTYAGLNLLVYSECDYDGRFVRNTFLVEGASGLKYRCGLSGALSLGFVESSRYPQAALAKLPGMIEEQRQKIAKLESEIPVLQGIIARKWSKTDELARLKQECNVLQHRIDESMKEAERIQSALSEHEATDKAA